MLSKVSKKTSVVWDPSATGKDEGAHNVSDSDKLCAPLSHKDDEESGGSPMQGSHTGSSSGVSGWEGRTNDADDGEWQSQTRDARSSTTNSSVEYLL